ncbi:MAG: 23S rRNA (adenine(2503)-C(2))-methyltransferase RlmN [Christensenellales bacterium]|jgi:23S rRNA (adenine2503-C2)-methyltransferase
MTSLMDLSAEELKEFVTETLNESAFRAAQIRKWLLSGADFGEMSNLPKALRETLRENCIANPVSIASARVSAIDGTKKYLYALPDGNLIEGVLMRYRHGDTLCLSTQVGCRMGCAFCASTIEGCARSLTPGEMLGQIVAVNRRIAPQGEKIHNVVLMGSGEPFDNYENVVKFLRLATDEGGLNLSVRSISLSTCGLVPAMRRFAEEGLPVTLSVSLHAPNDEIRQKIMPVAKVYPIGDVIDACRYYIEKTGRRVIFEYALIGGVNDSVRCADELAQLLRGMQCHVNLIPLNAVPERNLCAPTPRAVEDFLKRLEMRHISATRRREMGDDIEGACGQLRRSVLKREEATE